MSLKRIVRLESGSFTDIWMHSYIGDERVREKKMVIVGPETPVDFSDSAFVRRVDQLFNESRLFHRGFQSHIRSRGTLMRIGERRKCVDRMCVSRGVDSGVDREGLLKGFNEKVYW